MRMRMPCRLYPRFCIDLFRLVLTAVAMEEQRDRPPRIAVDMYRRMAGRRGALSQFRPGARGDTPPAPFFGTRGTRWGTA